LSTPTKVVPPKKACSWNRLSLTAYPMGAVRVQVNMSRSEGNLWIRTSDRGPIDGRRDARRQRVGQTFSQW
jgi:hypothetical protein